MTSTLSLPNEGRRYRDERGVLTAMFAMLMIFFIMIFALLAESGRKLNNLSRAEDLAAEVARAAGATLDLDRIADGVAEIDHVDSGDGVNRARVQAEKLLGDFDAASIETFVVSADSVFVQVRIEGTSFIPGFNLDAVGSHRALAFDPFG